MKPGLVQHFMSIFQQPLSTVNQNVDSAENELIKMCCREGKKKEFWPK